MKLFSVQKSWCLTVNTKHEWNFGIISGSPTQLKLSAALISSLAQQP